MQPKLTLRRVKKTGDPDRIFIRCSFEDKDTLKNAALGTARWRNTEKVWSVPVDPVVYGNILRALPNTQVGEDMQRYVDEQQDKQRRVVAATRDTRGIPQAAGLWTFQNSSVRFLIEVQKGLLAHEMGTGKTVITAAALKHLGPGRVIIVSPSVVSRSWVKHLQSWGEIRSTVLEAGYRLDPLEERATHLSMKGNRTQREEFLRGLRSTPQFCLVINYAQLRIHWDALTTLEPDVLVLDEAHRIKNARAQQSQAAHKLARVSDYVWLLTGTPVRTNYDDYYSLLHTLDPIRFSGYFNFLNIYLHHIPNIWGGVEILGVKDEERFNEVLSMYMYRKTKAEVLEDLPEKVYNEYPIAMAEEQAKAYAQMEKEFRLYLQKEDGPGVLHAPKTIQQMIRLRQIALNPAIIDGVDSSGKLVALSELIDDLDGRFLIFTQFRGFVPFIQNILDTKGVSHTSLMGGMSLDEIAEAERKLEQQEVQCLVGTIDAMGEAIDLPFANAAIFTDITWTPAVNAQAEDRIHRMGITESPTIIRLYHPNTIDEYIRRVCDRKEQIADATIGQIETAREMLASW